MSVAGEKPEVGTEVHIPAVFNTIDMRHHCVNGTACETAVSEFLEWEID